MKHYENLIIACQNYENYENNELLRISCQNHENHENLIVPRQNHKNNQMFRIPCQNLENHQNLRIPFIILKIIKFIEFHARITKIMKT